ncbi:MAG: hypothetical protein WCI77_03350 [Candidatus Omnitrophota bacterium]
MKKTIIIRCDGDSQVGLGHIYRCIALADELRKTYRCKIIFALIRGKEGIDLIKQAHYFLEKKPLNINEENWLNTIIKQYAPSILIFDIRTDLSRAALEGWRNSKMLTVIIDDTSSRRLAGNLVFCPPVRQIKKLDWKNFKGKLYTGWKWVILRKEFAKNYPKRINKIPQVLVTMGGSDPQAMTLKTIKALDFLRDNFNTVVVLGAGFKRNKELRVLLYKAYRPFVIRRNVKNIAQIMSKVDLAVASFGVTAYELAAIKVPAIYLCLTKDHAQSAKTFTNTGMAISVGVHNKVQEQLLAKKVHLLLREKIARDKMKSRCYKKIDAQGAERIAAVIINAVEATYG